MNTMKKGLRRAMVTGGAMAAMLGASLAAAPQAAAGGCSSWWEPCGVAENRTSSTMATTETLNEGPDWCDVWNAPDLGWHIRCTQKSLGPGGTRGGGTVDVDAFTFPGTRYFVMMYDGTTKWLDPGVWTKFPSNRKASCRDDWSMGGPVCSVN
ncbi:hypothetical protein [Streptomyces sp. NPDC001581]|uniref:hypothetical protein n=1 Tax=unclassified Streptomyces TaxID=2593676 RepID=UPI00333440BF